ncbi:DEAD/DEAH box helicase [Sphingobacterium lactis]|uniref:DEAD-box ATP-dependent RNA helicase RhpA n=1 Tax=Sphingobacterium lactis TaxID=797291 RepID=A0A1H5YNT7_9SPHI|nr:DEAD/DEAH box helicase [Sphingobacterium lactis]SEG25046.1 ATP-dependent RNA helicase RhlE [Sphingobacterium lactis]
MEFKNMDLIAPLLKAIQEIGYNEPTAIQQQAIPVLLTGKDIIGCAQTGTGKTAAFAIPLLQKIAQSGLTDNKTQALILVPTRELAIQIGQSLDAYSKYLQIKHTVIFGGVSQHKQVESLKKGATIIVATPGRLLDLLGQKLIDLRALRYFVLDEADNMLDMGFIHDIKKLLKVIPKERQTLLFSATMPKSIRKLAEEILRSPVEVQVSPVSSTAEKVSQQVYHVEKKAKAALLAKILGSGTTQQTLVFTRTKHGANRLVKTLGKSGILTACIHGNKSQNARQQALESFKSGKINVLIATDIAARGIDIHELPRVINYDLPEESETYVHRIGRTGRAGNAGLAFSFCSDEEKPLLLKIQKLIGFQIEEVKQDNKQ